MRRMSAGDGFRYLLKTVAVGDGDRALSTPLTRYYSEQGTPPGRWIGEGLPGLGEGQIGSGDQVTETQLQLLIGMGHDPVSGDALGRSYRRFKSLDERVAARIAALDPAFTPGKRAEMVARIEAEEAARGERKAVAAYDFTFSIPKSASVLWAVADVGTQQLIWQAHHAAVADVLQFMEREVAATRSGSAGPDGAVLQLDVAGLVAAGYDHFDSRANDPYLHTHVVVSNKVQTAHDGHWLALDGRPLHAATVALSELHEAVFADALTRLLGVSWEQRQMGRDRNPAWAITDVPQDLVLEFSNRSRFIEIEKEKLIRDYVERHGSRPSAATVLKMLQQATLSTRPEKTVRSLEDLIAEWRNRASALLGEDATAWASQVAWRNHDAAVAAGSDAQQEAGAAIATPLLRADDLPLSLITQLGSDVVAAVGEKRSTWRRWNLLAEAARQSMWLRFASTRDRELIVEMIADAAEDDSLRLTPAELALTPEMFQREDGATRFRPKHGELFSSEALLAAEDRLLARAKNLAAPTLVFATMERVAQEPDREGRRLGPDQVDALTRIAVSGRTVDILVGPAGTGKTTALAALRRAWEFQYGEGSVVGLAPSAVAAEILGSELGILAENTAKWREVFERTGQSFTRGQLVVLDEASLAGTHSLDQITREAERAGAKVLLVGDVAQLQAVDVGGAFSLLVHDRDGDTPELTEVWRLQHEWEKRASLELRYGHQRVIDTYVERGRVSGGTAEEMAEAAYQAWWADKQAGRASILIAETNDNVTFLNERARDDLIIAGYVDAERQIELHDGTSLGVGDTIITRKNDRRLRSARGWVRNGERWIVTHVADDGSATVRPPTSRRGGSILLPAAYVANSVELGYAVTAYRAQGVTVDTAHTLVEPTTTREVLYVSMTRGRYENRAYVATDHPDVAHSIAHPGDDPDRTARAVLHGVLQHVGAERSAHEAITAEQERWGGIAQLIAEYETIATAAQHDRWMQLLTDSGLSSEHVNEVAASEALGALITELRRAEANGYDLPRLLPALITARHFGDADDVAKVLHYRVEGATRHPRHSAAASSVRLIAGLFPEATGRMSAEMRTALTERRELIEERAAGLTDLALAQPGSWATAAGVAPRSGPDRGRWRAQLITVAAYRDRYGITDRAPLGVSPEGVAQRLDYARAEAALLRAQQIAARASQTEAPHRPTSSHDRHGPRR
ncbi:MobF family relaxase [Leucobacter ruminantium]